MILSPLAPDVAARRAAGADVVLEKTPLERYVPPAKPSLVGLSRLALAQALGSIGVPERQRNMRVSQIWHWLYVRGAQDFEAMSSVAKDLRAELAANFTLARPQIAAEQISVDGTRKWLLRLPGEHAGENPHEVECVYIPEADRGTLCLSTQVGCTLNCSFCHTGTQRLVRNLTAGEIAGQVMVARDRLNDWADRETPTGNRLVTNVVMMGMGEPLYNFDAVRDALLIAADNEGIGISRRRITLSTSGVVPNIIRTGEEIGVMLAVSLHAVRDELRNELVPLNRKYPIAELLQACRDYPGSSNARRITFEYVMLKGVNDSPAEAMELVRLLKRIPAKVNLIPFNPWPGAPYECPSDEAIRAFSDIVFAAGFSAPVRTPRGRGDVKKIVLAYSGGLDTSVILRWLQETYRCEVVTFTADLGQGEELEPARKKAELLGAKEIFIDDLREEFVRDFVFPMFRANALYEGAYLLGTSIARPLIAKRQIEIARQVGADTVAHGATGKGNDQVRFELSYYALAPDINVVAPWREWDLNSRTRLLDYADQHQIPIARDKRGEAPFSVDANLLHISAEGKVLEDPWVEPEEYVYSRTVAPEQAPDQPQYVEIDFVRGDPVAIDGAALSPAALLTRLNELGGTHGIGRLDLVENRFVGMKSRGVYETPGGTILWSAHPGIETLCLYHGPMQ